MVGLLNCTRMTRENVRKVDVKMTRCKAAEVLALSTSILSRPIAKLILLKCIE